MRRQNGFNKDNAEFEMNPHDEQICDDCLFFGRRGATQKGGSGDGTGQVEFVAPFVLQIKRRRRPSAQRGSEEPGARPELRVAPKQDQQARAGDGAAYGRPPRWRFGHGYHTRHPVTALG